MMTSENDIEAINDKLDKILNILESQNQVSEKIDSHINFIQVVYNCLRSPLTIFSGKALPKPLSFESSSSASDAYPPIK